MLGQSQWNGITNIFLYEYQGSNVNAEETYIISILERI